MILIPSKMAKHINLIKQNILSSRSLKEKRCLKISQNHLLLPLWISLKFILATAEVLLMYRVDPISFED